MTNISVRQNADVQAEDRSWLAGPHGTETNAMPGVTVDTALFGAPAKTNGYIKSGTAISETTTPGIWGPFDAARTRHGLLFQSIDTSHGDQRFGTAALVHGFVFGAKLPGGAPSAAIRTALPLIYFYA